MGSNLKAVRAAAHMKEAAAMIYKLRCSLSGRQGKKPAARKRAFFHLSQGADCPACSAWKILHIFSVGHQCYNAEEIVKGG